MRKKSVGPRIALRTAVQEAQECSAETSLTTSKQHDACEFESAIIVLMNDKTPVVVIKVNVIRCYFYANLEHSCKPGWSQEIRRCALNGRFLAPSQKLYEIIRDLKINKSDFLLFLKSNRAVLPADGEDVLVLRLHLKRAT
jgi:hypothetical protein